MHLAKCIVMPVNEDPYCHAYQYAQAKDRADITKPQNCKTKQQNTMYDPTIHWILTDKGWKYSVLGPPKTLLMLISISILTIFNLKIQPLWVSIQYMVGSYMVFQCFAVSSFSTVQTKHPRRKSVIHFSPRWTRRTLECALPHHSSICVAQRRTLHLLNVKRERPWTRHRRSSLITWYVDKTCIIVIAQKLGMQNRSDWLSSTNAIQLNLHCRSYNKLKSLS